MHAIAEQQTNELRDERKAKDDMKRELGDKLAKMDKELAHYKSQMSATVSS